MRSQKGITLIALVITIIVLLILAGVSIAMLTGKNGVLTRATEAKTETTTAEITERMGMAIQAAYADTIKPDATTTTLTTAAVVTQYNSDNAGHSTATRVTDTKVTVTVGEVEYTVTLETSGKSMKVTNVK